MILFFLLFCIWGLPSAVAQTSANQPPSPSAQGATQSGASAQSLEQEVDQEVAEAGNGKASLTEVNKELSNPISSIWGVAVPTKHLLAEQARAQRSEPAISAC